MSQARGSGELHVGRLRLRLQGTSGEQARRLVERALEVASSQLGVDLSGSVSALQLKISLPAGASEYETSHAIARALSAAVTRAGATGKVPPAATATAPGPESALAAARPPGGESPNAQSRGSR